MFGQEFEILPHAAQQFRIVAAAGQRPGRYEFAGQITVGKAERARNEPGGMQFPRALVSPLSVTAETHELMQPRGFQEFSPLVLRLHRGPIIRARVDAAAPASSREILAWRVGRGSPRNRG